jgi:LysR family transcriptional regulator, regulator for metE and metH
MIEIASTPQLTLRDLELVAAVHQAGSTVGAARLLHLGQPAVSRALAQIESKLGIPLFVRTTRGLTPTASGRAIAAGAGPILTQVLDLEATARAEPAPTLLRVAATCPTIYRWLPSAASKLRAGRSPIEIDLCPEPVSAAEPALRDGTADFVLTTQPIVERGFSIAAVTTDETVLVLAERHPLAYATRITPTQIRRHPLVIPTQVPEVEAPRLLARLHGRRPSPTQVIRLPLTEAILDVTRSSDAIAAISKWILDAHRLDDLRLRRPASGPLIRPWGIAHPHHLAEHATALARLLADAAPEPSTRDGTPIQQQPLRRGQRQPQ